MEKQRRENKLKDLKPKLASKHNIKQTGISICWIKGKQQIKKSDLDTLVGFEKNTINFM